MDQRVLNDPAATDEVSLWNRTNITYWWGCFAQTSQNHLMVRNTYTDWIKKCLCFQTHDVPHFEYVWATSVGHTQLDLYKWWVPTTSEKVTEILNCITETQVLGNVERKPERHQITTSFWKVVSKYAFHVLGFLMAVCNSSWKRGICKRFWRNAELPLLLVLWVLQCQDLRMLTGTIVKRTDEASKFLASGWNGVFCSDWKTFLISKSCLNGRPLKEQSLESN